MECVSEAARTMFRILGSDGNAQGPVSADTLRQWIGEGRVTARTLIQSEGSDRWQPLPAMPEFAEALKGARAAFPPPLPRTPPALAGSDRPRARCGSATVALILGLLGPCTAILGVVFGIVALNR